MRNSRPWLYVFLPFLYLAIVLGFVAFQFSKKSDSFSQSLGDLTISGKSSAGGQPADLVLRGRGLEFPFDSSHFLQFEGTDGTSGRLRPLSWAWKDGSIDVTFQQGVEILFEKVGTGGRSLQIHPVPNEALRKFSAFHIPFGAQGGTRLVRSDRNTFLGIEQDKNRLLASVDGGQDRIELDNTFVIVAGKNGFRPARIDPVSGDMSAELAWLTLDTAATPATAEASLAQYWDKAYAAWASSSAFSTPLAAAWGQEALLRGEYPVFLQKIQNLLDRDRQTWGFEAAPLLGNIVELTAQERRAVETASSRSQPDWEGQGSLWLDARLYGPSGSADRVKGLLLGSKLPDTAPGLVALFQNLMDIQALQPSDALSDRINDVLNTLLSQVVRREGELFVRNSDGYLDLRSGLVLGRLFLGYSRNLANEPYASAGAQLVASALAYQDPLGHLPEILVTQNGKIIRQEGAILPESVYPTVKPVVRTETELDGWGPGAFIKTPAKLVAKSVTDSEARFSFRFPSGAAEHIILAGVPPFDHLTLHGIRWRTDPQFQSYTDGWVYSASTKTLYVKIKHREDLEDLIVHFQPEQ